MVVVAAAKRIHFQGGVKVAEAHALFHILSIARDIGLEVQDFR